ncbi:hypothetical protein LX32DRAFT_319333 [Colletotrichum zoysiae]|uniref:Uncharacterized protein n=1 Tax=Colletotrichum zoysiae TaxID=1216348 RepID=A0AAD9H376_9PEZI|nr:hypothetical protein LX32DRAFT_319333 [Colletotrichum zoysiae]
MVGGAGVMSRFAVICMQCSQSLGRCCLGFRQKGHVEDQSWRLAWLFLSISLARSLGSNCARRRLVLSATGGGQRVQKHPRIRSMKGGGAGGRFLEASRRARQD